MNRTDFGGHAGRRWRAAAPLLTLVAVGALAAGCTSTGSDSASSGAASSAPQGSAAQPAASGDLSLIMVGHGPESDPTAVIMVRGMNDACQTFGFSECKYRGATTETFSAADQAAIIEAAIAEQPDVMLITDPTPEGLNPSIQEAIAAGIKVALVNQATEKDVIDTGALQAVAADPYTTGKLVGEQLIAAGVKRPLIMSVTPGIPFVDQRVDGIVDAYPEGAVNVLQLPLETINNPTAVVQGTQAALVKDEQVDGVLSVGVLFNPPMLAVRDNIGDRGKAMKWASIDVGEAVMAGLEAGDVTFAADEQPYLQTFQAVQTAYLAMQGVEPGQQFIKSGPVFVTPDNLEQYKIATEAGVRG